MELLSLFRDPHLGINGARHLQQYTQTRLLKPLGPMDIADKAGDNLVKEEVAVGEVAVGEAAMEEVAVEEVAMEETSVEEIQGMK